VSARSIGPAIGSAAGQATEPASADAALRRATTALSPRAGELAAARLEAELLLAHALGVERPALLLAGPLSAHAQAAFAALVEQRVATGRPVAYLLGRRSFFDLELLVDERVLIPRPESERVVEVALALLAEGQAPAGLLADRGTGSGCLALVLSRARPVLAIDVSAEALQVAEANAARAGLLERVLPVRADGLSCVRPASLALVVANPPYVEPHELAGLPEDVRRHEPHAALVPSEGSVAAMFARLLAEARAALAPRGWLVTEVGAGQAALVAGLASAAGYGWTAIHSDAAGIERVVAARA
jgi:release factor glutamine methyltransferase